MCAYHVGGWRRVSIRVWPQRSNEWSTIGYIICCIFINFKLMNDARPHNGKINTIIKYIYVYICVCLCILYICIIHIYVQIYIWYEIYYWTFFSFMHAYISSIRLAFFYLRECNDVYSTYSKYIYIYICICEVRVG